MLKVACIGAGYFSQFHYEAWRRIDEVQLVASVDVSLDAAKKTGAPAFRDLQVMLDEVEPDIVDIITPPSTHADTIKQAIDDGGVKLIICQKPFCQTYEEAEEVVALCEQAKVQLIIHENFRFQPWYRAMKQAAEDGMIGDVHQLTFKMRTGDGQGPNAYLDRQPYFQKMQKFLIHETGVHWIDTFCFLMGQPISVYADLRRMNDAIAGEDAGYFIMEFEKGQKALFDGNRHLDHASENCRLTFGECYLQGTLGTLSLDGTGSVFFRRFGARDAQLIFGLENPHQGFAGDCVYHLQRHIIDAMINKAAVENSGREYLTIMRLENLIYQSAQSNQKLKI